MIHWLLNALLVAAGGMLWKGITEILDVRNQRRAWRAQGIVTPYGPPGSVRRGVYFAVGGLAVLGYAILIALAEINRPPG